MDSGILGDFGVVAENPRHAYVDDFELRIGNRATLVPKRAARAYGSGVPFVPYTPADWFLEDDSELPL